MIDERLEFEVKDPRGQRVLHGHHVKEELQDKIRDRFNRRVPGTYTVNVKRSGGWKRFDTFTVPA